MSKHASRVTWLLMLLSLSTSALAGDFIARLDRERVVEGDPVVLTLSASGGISGTPDLTPLQKSFDLINRGQSTHMRIVNGRSFSGTEWHLTLMPKNTGKIEIPAIKFGTTSSQPLTLEVLPASQAAQQGMPQPVMVEVDAEPKRPYVQQKFIYTVRLLFAMPLHDPKLAEPGIDDALVRPLGDERRFETYRNGRQYQAIERRYAVQPQRSGPLKIGGPLLSARISEPGQKRGSSLRDRFFGSDPFSSLSGSFGQTRPIRVKGPELNIDVQPQPAGTSSPWLPAESLTLNESWSPNPPEFHVGEPVTRTIAITAQGLAGEQLPNLTFDVPPGMKVYAEKPRAETRPDKDTLVAQKIIRAALVPARSGDVTLPEIRVTWWDVGAHKEVVARLPSRRIEVSLPPGTVAGNALQANGRASDHGSNDAVGGQPPRSLTETADAPNGQARYWPWIAAILGVALVLITGLWLRDRRTRATATQTAQKISPTANEPKPDPARKLSDVEQAFLANDPKRARQALLAWAETRWPSNTPRRLDAIAEQLGDPSASVIFGELDSALYADSGGAGAWDGRTAWVQLKKLLKHRVMQNKKISGNNGLPPLYPEAH